MELDKRIKDINAIQTILRYDVNCIGCKGYFFDEFIQTKDLSKCRYGELIDITTHDDRNDLCFKAEYKEGLVGFYRFFISEADLKPIEKKYRPFSYKEFCRLFDFGDGVCFRRKGQDTAEFSMYLGYEIDTDGNRDEIPGEGKVNLGGNRYTLAELFEYYEMQLDDEWQPFGIEVEEK